MIWFCHILADVLLCPGRMECAIPGAGRPSQTRSSSIGPGLRSWLCHLATVGLRASRFLSLSFFDFKMDLALDSILKGYFAVPGTYVYSKC